jgi:hypothetical protein
MTIPFLASEQEGVLPRWRQTVLDHLVAEPVPFSLAGLVRIVAGHTWPPPGPKAQAAPADHHRRRVMAAHIPAADA